jgi:flagellar basal body-associated protein FliL
MAEEQESGGSLKSILIGLVSTVTIAVGGFITKQLTGEEEAEQPAQTSAPAPVINITTNNTQQQKQASGGGTKVIERVVEKPAKEKPKPKTAKEELEEAPKW